MTSEIANKETSEARKPERAVRPVHYVQYAGWLATAWLFRLLPRRATVLLADAIGSFIFHILRMRRDVVEQNLETAFGKTMSRKERKRLALRVYQNSVLTMIEFVQPEPLFRPGRELYTDGGTEHLESMRKEKALVLTAHLGNWEAMATYGAGKGMELTALVKAMHNPLVDRDIVRRRNQKGMEVLTTGSLMKTAVSVVRRGRWLVFLSDQDARRQGIFVDFFGVPASTALGAAYFAWRLNKPILPIFCTRDRSPLRKLVIRWYPPIYPDPEAEREQELQRLTQAHVRLLEQVVSEHPEDYFWFHRRWKTRPKGKAEGGRRKAEEKHA